MTRRGWRRAGGAVVILVVALGASSLLGSRPQAGETDAPVAVCPDTPNCARLRVAVAAPPADVRAAARRALAATGGWTGSPESLAETPEGALAAVRLGPFVDDVEVEVENAPRGAVLWVRSASRTGKSDLGVNALRARRLVDAVAGLLPDGAVER